MPLYHKNHKHFVAFLLHLCVFDPYTIYLMIRDVENSVWFGRGIFGRIMEDLPLYLSFDTTGSRCSTSMSWADKSCQTQYCSNVSHLRVASEEMNRTHHALTDKPTWQSIALDVKTNHHLFKNLKEFLFLFKTNINTVLLATTKINFNNIHVACLISQCLQIHE